MRLYVFATHGIFKVVPSIRLSFCERVLCDKTKEMCAHMKDQLPQLSDEKNGRRDNPFYLKMWVKLILPMFKFTLLFTALFFVSRIVLLISFKTSAKQALCVLTCTVNTVLIKSA